VPLKTPEMTDEPNLNLTPMIDIVFLLLIFFIAAGTQLIAETNQEREYDINLPAVSDAPPLTSLPDEVVVNVLADGNIVADGAARSLAELRQLLVAKQTSFPNQGVVIRGDRTVPYQRVMEVLEACKESKIRHVSLAGRIQANATE
jgi:biopolymer transport protein ExbD